MKKILVVIAVVAAAALAGCAPPNATSAGGGTFVQVVQMPDDTSVDCVTRGNSMSCDWERRS